MSEPELHICLIVWHLGLKSSCTSVISAVTVSVINTVLRSLFGDKVRGEIWLAGHVWATRCLSAKFRLLDF